jgi:hypothetical protein
LKPGAPLTFDGERAVTQVVRELSCQYRLLQKQLNVRRA